MNFYKLKKYFSEDLITIYVCVISLLIGWYALQSDFSFFEINNSLSTENSIGRVETVESDVRTRGLKNIFWKNSHINDSISIGDSLFVGANSSITIKFEDGKQITIGSNSLVKFKSEDNKIKLNLQYGLIKSQNLPNQIVLDDCGKTLDITNNENADLEIGKSSDCGKLQVKAKKGTLKVNNTLVDSSKDYNIESSPIFALKDKPIVNDAISKLESLPTEELKKIKEFSAEDLKKQIISDQKIPDPPKLIRKLSKILLDINKTPAASWLEVDNAKEYILETSSGPDFVSPTIARSDSTIHKVESLGGDKLYYRLKTVGHNNKVSEYSEVGEIEFTYPPIKIINPQQVVEFVAKNSKDLVQTKKININWTDIPDANKYVIEVDSKNGDFSNPKKYSSRSPASVISVSEQGKYKYRVAAYNAQERKISSSINLGEIVYSRLFDMKAPLIEKTVSNLQFYFQNGFGKYIWLKWSSPEAKVTDKYRIEVSKDEQFSSLFKVYTTYKTKVLLQDSLPAGNYFWRVRAESTEAKEQVSDWSNLGQIEISTGN